MNNAESPRVGMIGSSYDLSGHGVNGNKSIPKKVYFLAERIKEPKRKWVADSINFNSIALEGKRFSDLKEDARRKLGSSTEFEIISTFELSSYWSKEFHLSRSLLANVLELIDSGFKLYNLEIKNHLKIFNSIKHSDKFSVHEIIQTQLENLPSMYTRKEASELYLKVHLYLNNFNVQIISVPDPRCKDPKSRRKILLFKVLDAKTGRVLHEDTQGFLLNPSVFFDLGLLK